MYDTARINPTRAARGNRWFSSVSASAEARLRLFCFPYAGGGASIYRTWAQQLPDTVAIYPVQLPGRESRLSEEPFSTIPPLVQAVAQALLPYMDVPFAFFGHSMGALIGFELARELRRRGGPAPAHLFVSGRWAPHIPNANPPTFDLPESEFIEELRRLNGTPSEVLEHPELRQMVLPLLRADFKICETYFYENEPALDCPISAYGGLQDPDVSLQNLREWQRQTSSSFKLSMYSGDHFFLHTVQSQLVQDISRDLLSITRG